MASCFDVAKYILEHLNQTTTIKLHKLVYYCQAWSLVWDDEPLFEERIEAWANGPVVPDLFAAHKGKYKIQANDLVYGDSKNLSNTNKETIDAVLKTYKSKSAQWLIELTHLEDPWKDARGECLPGETCSTEITHQAMAHYYSGL